MIEAEFESIEDDPPPTVRGNDNLSAKMAAIPMIESWCTAVRAAVEAELLHGNTVEGFKLVEGRRGNRKWVDDKQVIKLLKKEFGIGKQLYIEESLMSPSALEKELKDFLDPQQFERLFALTSRTEGRPSVALESDKRPAMLVIPTSDDFEVIHGAD